MYLGYDDFMMAENDHKVKATAWAASTAGDKLENIEISLEPLAADEVQVKILACGLCFSDIDACAGKFPPSMYQFPNLVPGHEGAGVVTAVGSAVTSLKVGQQVGCGIYRGCCSTCKFCRCSKDNLCPQKKMMFAMGVTGCFGSLVHIDHRFAFPIPEGLDPKYAGPLLCAGQTVYGPFFKYGIKGPDTIAVLGIGGLGHLALQFGRAKGCNVYAISRNRKKEEDARKLGANNFIDMSDPASIKAATGKLDYIFMTASGAKPDWDQLIGLLGPGGLVVFMGLPENEVKANPIPMLMGSKGIVGSGGCPSGGVQEMLEFCAVNRIKPWIKEFPFNQVNTAVEEVKAGSVRFRAVLVRED